MRGIPNRRTHRCRGAALGTGLTCSKKGEKAGRGQGVRPGGAQDGMRLQKQAEVRHMGHRVQSRCGGEVVWGSDSSPAHVSAVILQLMPIQSSLSREIGTRGDQTRQRGGGGFGLGGGSSGGEEERGSGFVTGWAEPT